MPSPSLLQQSSKPSAVEELLDTYFFRRLAAPLIPWLARWGLTPNQVTGLACLAGLAASASFWAGSFGLGGLLIILAVVLDCSDGMLARFLGRSDPLGRILDGFAYTVWVVCMYVAIWASPVFASYDRV